MIRLLNSNTHSRVYHFSSNCFKSTKQNNQSLYTVKQIINSISPTTNNKLHFDLLPPLNKSQISEVVVTVPIRSNSVQYDNVPLSLSHDTVHNGTVLEVAYPALDRTDIVQYGTSLSQDLVPFTVPIRLNPLQYDTVPSYDIVPPSGSPGAVHYDYVPESAHTSFTVPILRNPVRFPI